LNWPLSKSGAPTSTSLKKSPFTSPAVAKVWPKSAES